MKCPSCGKNHKRKEGLTCGSCNYKFVFDPKRDGIADGKFAAMLRAVIQNGERYFTFNQLYMKFAQKQKRMGKVGIFVVAVLIGVAGALTWYEVLPFFCGGVLMLIFVAIFVKGIAPPPGPEKVERWVKKWKRAPRPLDKMLEKPGLHEPPPEWREPDIYDYGVERILVVDRDLYVDLFVRNGLHAEQRALVIAESGYPQYLQDRVAELLRERRDLPVFLLHDASDDGVGMAKRLPECRFLPLEGHPVVDCGIFPDDVLRMKRFRNTRAQQEKFRGLLDDVLVLAMGEFGRTPQLGTQGSTDGRNHWPYVMSMTLAGGGFRHGQVIGATERDGGHIKERPVTPGDLAATIYHHMQVPLDTTYTDHRGRPHPIVQNGQPIRELI